MRKHRLRLLVIWFVTSSDPHGLTFCTAKDHVLHQHMLERTRIDVAYALAITLDLTVSQGKRTSTFLDPGFDHTGSHSLHQDVTLDRRVCHVEGAFDGGVSDGEGQQRGRPHVEAPEKT
ncbi:hypothetical protein D3C85_1366250 [compost metagenome]